MLTHLMHKSACQMDGAWVTRHVCRMQSQEIPLTSSIYCISESSVAPASKEKSKKETQNQEQSELIAERRRVETSTGAFLDPTGTERPGDSDSDPDIDF